MPERKSFTSDCAPKPSAMPAMPAPAMSGPRLMPRISSTVSNAIDQIAMVTMLRTTAPMVSARCVRRACGIGPVSTNDTAFIDASFSTPPLRCFTRRRLSTRVIRTRIHAPSSTTTMRMGFDSASATSAAFESPVMR